MSIFDLAQEFQPEKAKKQKGGYTTTTLGADLEKVYIPGKQNQKKDKGTRNIYAFDRDSCVSEIRSRCAKLFLSSCETINLEKMESTEKFQYLKFFYYMGKTYSEWRKNGYNLFKCLDTPSERHQQYYIKMLKEILDNKEKLSLNPQVAEEVEGRDSQGYGDAFHTVQQWINHMAFGLYTRYDDSISNAIDNFHTLNRTLDEYVKKSAHLDRNFSFKLSCWDELCLMLARNRDLYWEYDLLEAHRMVYHIVQEEDNQKVHSLMYPDKQFFSVNDHCRLLYQNGKIVERFPPFQAETDVTDTSSAEFKGKEYLDALEVYVKENIDELTTKIFSKSPPDRSKKGWVINRFPAVRAYWEMEQKRYGRNCNLLKSKLIAIYQVFFMTLPRTGIDFSKPKTPKMRENGKLYPESKNLSASYVNPSQKEPLYLQLICIWSDVQEIHYSLPSESRKYYSKLYSEINIKTLEALTAIDWKMRPVARQVSAESILFLTIDTLSTIRLSSKNCISISRRLKQCLEPVDMTLAALISFHAFEIYCKLFHIESAVKLIVDEKKKLPDEQSFSVSLNTYSADAILFQNLALKIEYIPQKKFYRLNPFPNHLIENLLNEEERICQNRDSAAGV